MQRFTALGDVQTRRKTHTIFDRRAVRGFGFLRVGAREDGFVGERSLTCCQFTGIHRAGGVLGSVFSSGLAGWVLSWTSRKRSIVTWV